MKTKIFSAFKTLWKFSLENYLVFSFKLKTIFPSRIDGILKSKINFIWLFRHLTRNVIATRLVGTPCALSTIREKTFDSIWKTNFPRNDFDWRIRCNFLTTFEINPRYEGPLRFSNNAPLARATALFPLQTMPCVPTATGIQWNSTPNYLAKPKLRNQIWGRDVYGISKKIFQKDCSKVKSTN